MKKEFKVYKEGTTKDKVVILSNPKESFDRDEKIKKYLELGYTVYDMNNKKITK